MYFISCLNLRLNACFDFQGKTPQNADSSCSGLDRSGSSSPVDGGGPAGVVSSPVLMYPSDLNFENLPKGGAVSERFQDSLAKFNLSSITKK